MFRPIYDGNPRVIAHFFATTANPPPVYCIESPENNLALM